MHTAYTLRLNDMCFETTAGARTYPQTPPLRLFSSVLLFAATARGRLQSFAWTRKKQSRGKCLQARLAETDSRKVWRNWRMLLGHLKTHGESLGFIDWQMHLSLWVRLSCIHSYINPGLLAFSVPVWLSSKIPGPDLSTYRDCSGADSAAGVGYCRAHASFRTTPAASFAEYALYLKGCCC